MFEFKRNDNILKRKFYQYLLPSVLSVAATSLNEFLDSIVVAQTLGSDAMAMVNMACPIMLVFSTIYVLFGVGGSTVYATLKGQMENDKASSILSVTMVISAIFSVLVLIAGLVFLDPLSNMLSSGISLTITFTDYVKVLFISAPFIILLQTLLMFFPCEGMPQITTAVNIIANVVNIIFDYIYIEIFGFDLSGAAYATLTGYIVGIIVIVCLWLFKKYRIRFGSISKKAFASLSEMIGKGAASAVGQFGFFIKISFSNHVVVTLAGTIGITVFSACFQTVSIISIFIGGVLNAMIPIVAILFGQRDYNGIRLLMKNILKMEIILSIVLFIFFEAFPRIVFAVYNINAPEELEFGIPALRIFSFMYLFRQTVLMFIYYLQTIGRKIYAVILSLIDGFAGIIVLTLLFYKPFGVDGHMLAYPVCSLLMVVGIVLTNLLIIKKSSGNVSGMFLLPKSTPDEGLDFTLKADPKEISLHSEKLMEYLCRNGIEKGKATIVAVACEELCIYTSENSNHKSEIDALIRISDENICMNFRSIGPAFSPLSISNPEQYSNIDILNKIAKEVRYDYVIGMNQMQVLI